MKKVLQSVLLLATLVGAVSCTKHKDEVTPVNNYSVSTTYDYANFATNSADAKTLLASMKKLVDSAKAGNTQNVKVSATVLRNIFENEGSPLTLKSVTNSSFHTTVDVYFDSLAIASNSTTNGSDGVAGVIVSNNGLSKKLYDARGNAVYELIEKGLMGSLQYYQITAVYLSDEKIGASVPTAQRQKNWDMAFGFLGLPIDYPTTAGSGFWAGYMASVSVALGNNKEIIMNAFLKGRAAIDNGDNNAVSEAAATIKKELERTAAGMSLRYLKRAKASLLASPVDHGPKSGALSEGKGFISCLKYNPSKVISDAQIASITTALGNDNWDVTEAIINQAISDIATIYNLDSTLF